MTRISFARPLAVSGLVALVVLVAACGGSSTTATPTTTATTVAGSAASRLAAFRTCMQQQGVTLPANFALGGRGFGGAGRGAGAGTGAGTTTPSSTPRTAPSTTLPPGVTEAQYQAALKACSASLPTRGALANNPQVQNYYNCLQTYLMTHGGTTLPPLSSGGGALFGGGRGFGGPGTTVSGETTTTNPTLQAAQTHCAPLRPTFGGGTTTTTSIG